MFDYSVWGAIFWYSGDPWWNRETSITVSDACNRTTKTVVLHGMRRRKAKERNIQALVCNNTYYWQELIKPATGSREQWVVCSSCHFRSQLQAKMKECRICCWCCRRRNCYWRFMLNLHMETYSRNVFQFSCNTTPGKLLSKSYSCRNI